MFTLLLCYISVVSANVLGFDFGSSYMKATLVKPGSPFSIVENTASQRKTNNMLTLGAENRMFGADSLLESGKYPKTTFMEMARLFGQPFEQAAIDELKRHRYVFNELVEDERNQVGWKIMRAAYGNEEEKEQLLHSEEIVAMMFATVKGFAEKQAGGSVRDCVITVPSWFTYEQRLMIKDAAELANMKVL